MNEYFEKFKISIREQQYFTGDYQGCGLQCKAVIFIFILLFSRNHCSLIQIQYMVDDANYIPLFSCVKLNKAFSIYRK